MESVTWTLILLFLAAAYHASRKRPYRAENGEPFENQLVEKVAYPDKDYSVTYVAEIEAAYEMEE